MAIELAVVDPDDIDARAALGHYLAEVAALIPSASVGPHEIEDVDDYRAPDGAFVLVRDGGAVVGCGAIRTIEPGVGEIKRMWIDPSQRGHGSGARLLEELEALARRLGHTSLVLDTNRVLTVALRLYESHGYVPSPRYNQNPDATDFFRKSLAD